MKTLLSPQKINIIILFLVCFCTKSNAQSLASFGTKNFVAEKLLDNSKVILIDTIKGAENNDVDFSIDNDFASNGNYGNAIIDSKKVNWETNWRLGYNDNTGYEVETELGFYTKKSRRLFPFLGFEFRLRELGIDEQEKNMFGQVNTKDFRKLVCVGLKYVIPWGDMLLQGEVFQDGGLKVQLKRDDFKIGKKFLFSFLVNTDKEWMTCFKYLVVPGCGLTARYDSDMGLGFGVDLIYN